MKKITLFLIIIMMFSFDYLYSQTELYYWGDNVKYTLTANSIEAVLIPKDDKKIFSVNNLIGIHDFEQIIPITNRNEILLKVHNKSVLIILMVPEG